MYCFIEFSAVYIVSEPVKRCGRATAACTTEFATAAWIYTGAVIDVFADWVWGVFRWPEITFCKVLGVVGVRGFVEYRVLDFWLKQKFAAGEQWSA